MAIIMSIIWAIGAFVCLLFAFWGLITLWQWVSCTIQGAYMEGSKLQKLRQENQELRKNLTDTRIELKDCQSNLERNKWYLQALMNHCGWVYAKDYNPPYNDEVELEVVSMNAPKVVTVAKTQVDSKGNAYFPAHSRVVMWKRL